MAGFDKRKAGSKAAIVVDKPASAEATYEIASGQASAAAIALATGAPMKKAAKVATPFVKTVAEAPAAFVEATAKVADAVQPAAVAVADAAQDAGTVVVQAAESAAEDVNQAVAASRAEAVGQAEDAVAEAQPPVTAPIDPNPAAPFDRAAADTWKGLFGMATTAPVSPQAAFGEFNERAKGAFEKSAKFGEEFVEFTKGNVEALVASARVAQKGSEALAQDAAEYGKKSFENATTAFKGFASVKSPTELFQLQSEFAKSSFDSAVAEASKFSEGWLKLAGDVFQPLSSRYAVATEKFKGGVAL